MNNLTFTKKHPVPVLYDPRRSRFTDKAFSYDNDLFLFSVNSEYFLRTTPEDIRIIGGRFESYAPAVGSILSDSVDLPGEELPLLLTSIYDLNDSTFVFPLKKDVFVLCNHLIRRSGLGVAFSFRYSPKCIASITKTDFPDTLYKTFISESFASFSPRSAGAADLAGSFSSLNNIFSRILDPAVSTVKVDDSHVFNMITSAADLSDARLSVIFPASTSSGCSLDPHFTFSAFICLMCALRGNTVEERINISVTDDEYTIFSIENSISGSAELERIICITDFCDRMAEDMVFPFRADINGLNYSIRFTPTRDLPSAISFKSGLYINGKRIMRRRL